MSPQQTAGITLLLLCVAGLGALSFCELALEGTQSLSEIRRDPSAREITFGIDSGACATVVP